MHDKLKIRFILKLEGGDVCGVMSILTIGIGSWYINKNNTVKKISDVFVMKLFTVRSRMKAYGSGSN